MSKQIKQMEMEVIRDHLKDVRDLVVLSITGVDSQEDNKMRLALRKKNIHMHLVKNSLARRVFDDLGMKVTSYWAGPTTLAWGSTSLADLSREFDGLAKKNKKIGIK